MSEVCGSYVIPTLRPIRMHLTYDLPSRHHYPASAEPSRRLLMHVTEQFKRVFAVGEYGIEIFMVETTRSCGKSCFQFTVSRVVLCRTFCKNLFDSPLCVWGYL